MSTVTAKKRKNSAFMPCFISSIEVVIKGEKEEEKEEERKDGAATLGEKVCLFPTGPVAASGEVDVESFCLASAVRSVLIVTRIFDGLLVPVRGVGVSGATCKPFDFSMPLFNPISVAVRSIDEADRNKS
jgi:hypothetical protein